MKQNTISEDSTAFQLSELYYKQYNEYEIPC